MRTVMNAHFLSLGMLKCIRTTRYRDLCAAKENHKNYIDGIIGKVVALFCGGSYVIVLMPMKKVYN